MASETINAAASATIATIINIVVPIAVVALLSYLLPRIYLALALSIATVRQKIGEARWDRIMNFVAFAVQAAEQAGVAAQLKGAVLDKKGYCLSALQALAASRGLGNLDIAAWDALIEGTVAQYNWAKLFPAPSPEVPPKTT